MAYGRTGNLIAWVVAVAFGLVCFLVKRNWHVLTSLLSGRQTLFVTIHDLTAECHEPADPRDLSYYIYTAVFRMEKGQLFALEISEKDYLSLNKGVQGRLTFQGRWFRSFTEGTKESLPPIRQTPLQRLVDTVNERRFKTAAARREHMQPEPDKPMRLDLLDECSRPSARKEKGVLTHELEE